MVTSHAHDFILKTGDTDAINVVKSYIDGAPVEQRVVEKVLLFNDTHSTRITFYGLATHEFVQLFSGRRRHHVNADVAIGVRRLCQIVESEGYKNPRQWKKSNKFHLHERFAE